MLSSQLISLVRVVLHVYLVLTLISVGDNAIQETVEAAIVNHSDKITSGRSSSGFVRTSVSIEARVVVNIVQAVCGFR